MCARDYTTTTVFLNLLGSLRSQTELILSAAAKKPRVKSQYNTGRKAAEIKSLGSSVGGRILSLGDFAGAFSECGLQFFIVGSCVQLPCGAFCGEAV